MYFYHFTYYMSFRYRFCLVSCTKGISLCLFYANNI